VVGGVVVLLALVAAVLAGLDVAGRSGSSSTPEVALTSELVSSTGALSPITAAPNAYRVVYRVETYDDQGKANASTEEVLVRRPFDGRITSKAGEPPGGAVQWTLTNSLGLVADATAGQAPDVSQVPPGAAAGDIRVDGSIADLVDQGLFVPRERRRVLGRDCQVYRTGQPLESAAVAPPSDQDHTDACVDASGLLLEEVSVMSGKLSLRTLAVELDVAARPTDDVFAITGTPVPLDQGGPQLVPIDAATDPVPGYWKLTQPPAGFTYQGRDLLRTAGPTGSDGKPGPTVESYVDLYVNGADYLVVLQGTSAGEPQHQPSEGKPVDLGPLGQGQFDPGVAGSTLIVHPAPGFFVDLMGTLPGSALEQVAGTLHRG
jgi:hypothetical protein